MRGRRSFATMADRAWRKMLPVPFCFMGMGIFRVWTETLFANNQIAFPAQILPFSVPIPAFDAYTLFDYTGALVLIILAVCARWVAPLYRHPFAIVLTVTTMIACVCINFASVLHPELSGMLCLPSAVTGGVGIALILMLWSEFFGCINPMRVVLYYSASVAVGCVILWIFKGLSFWWLWFGTCVIPIMSLLCLWRAYATLPRESYPPTYRSDFSFPWKPVTVIAVYSFVYGLRGGVFSGYLAMNSGIGAFLGALLVYVLLCASVKCVTKAQEGAARGDFSDVTDVPDDPHALDAHAAADSAFDFSLLWKIAMPLMVISLLPFDSLGPAWAVIADTAALASYTILLMLIMAILSSLSFRYGVCALWIFSIERAVRMAVSQTGRLTGEVLKPVLTDPFVHAAIVVGMVAALVLVALIFFSEKQVSTSHWGVVLKKSTVEFGDERNHLGVKCQEMGTRMGLTDREHEILLLVAQGHSQGEIARELYIGTNTVKTHTKHVYQKLGVHSRTELLDALGVRRE